MSSGTVDRGCFVCIEGASGPCTRRLVAKLVHDLSARGNPVRAMHFAAQPEHISEDGAEIDPRPVSELADIIRHATEEERVTIVGTGFASEVTDLCVACGRVKWDRYAGLPKPDVAFFVDRGFDAEIESVDPRARTDEFERNFLRRRVALSKVSESAVFNSIWISARGGGDVSRTILDVVAVLSPIISGRDSLGKF
jgi:hypothetical protein